MDLTGQYLLTFEAGNSCEQLPRELRTRTYEAGIEYIGAARDGTREHFRANLSGAHFDSYGRFFVIRVIDHYVHFDFSDSVIVEVPDPGTYLLILGGAGDATVDPASVKSVCGAIIVLTACVCAMAACDGEIPSQPSPSLPSPPSTPTTQPPSPVLFSDRVTAFSTTDVYDAREQIVRFNTAGELIWAADDTRYTSGRVIVGNWVEAILKFPVNGEYVGQSVCLGSAHCTLLMVRFGTINGARRAYLTPNPSWFHTQGSLMVDADVTSGEAVITATSTPVPGSPP